MPPRGASPLDPAGGLRPTISRLLLASSITAASGRRLEPRPFGLKGPTRERLSDLRTGGGTGHRCLVGTRPGRRLAGGTPCSGGKPLGWGWQGGGAAPPGRAPFSTARVALPPPSVGDVGCGRRRHCCMHSGSWWSALWPSPVWPPAVPRANCEGGNPMGGEWCDGR